MNFYPLKIYQRVESSEDGVDLFYKLYNENTRRVEIFEIKMILMRSR